MAIDTGICNSALTKVGANRILALTDDSVEGRVCREQYSKIKKSFLRGHLWNFATRRASLNLLTTEPVYEFAYQYSLPVDCLRVVSVEGEGQFPWKVEGRYLLTDNPEANIKYIANVAEGMFDDSAAEALAYALAVDICIPLTQSDARKKVLADEALKALREARTFDAQEGAGDRVYADTWLNARY